jgi:hypothetical protein
MKAHILSIIILNFSFVCLLGQVGINTDTPHANSALHVITLNNSSILLPSVDNITNAIDPENDSSFEGAVIYENKTGSIYEHDGTKWSSVYNFELNIKPEYIAHFTRTNYTISCTSFLGCNTTGILPWVSNGDYDFKGSNIQVSLNGTNNIQIDEGGIYRVSYRTYARRSGGNTEEILSYLQHSTDSGSNWYNIHETSYHKDEDNDGFKPILQGTIIMYLNQNDLLRVQVGMNAGAATNRIHNAHFEDKSAYGIGEFILEKIIL